MFDWICALTADCFTCQNNKPKPMHRKEVPLEEWQNETVPFCTIHIDHKGPFHPNSASNVHCLLIVDAFSRFLTVYPVRNTTTVATITAVEKWMLSFGIPQSIIHDRCTAFINTEFIKCTKELGITQRPRTAHSPWTNGKIETQNQHIARYRGSFLNDARNIWFHKHRSLHSPTIQVSTTRLEKPHMKLSLGPNHKFLCPSRWDFNRINNNFAVPKFVKTSLLIPMARTA